MIFIHWNFYIAYIYTYTACIDYIKSSTNKSQHSKQSFSQDLVYAITNGQVKTPKSMLNPYGIKELIIITCRWGHGISFFTVEELSIEIAYQKLETVEEESMRLPEECIMDRFTIEADGNIDRLSGTKKFNISSQ